MEPEELTLMRIFIGENDRYRHQPLYQALVELFHQQGLAGATVLKGAMGFGSQSVVHADRLLRLSTELPVVVEVVESEERIQGILPQIENMFQGGLITLEKARVIRFGKEDPSC